MDIGDIMDLQDMDAIVVWDDGLSDGTASAMRRILVTGRFVIWF